MKKNKYSRVFAGLLGLISSVMVAKPSFADDTEIFFSKNHVGIRQNVMFIVDGSGSMNLKVSEGGPSRLDVMKRVLSLVLKNAPDSLNVGLMNYGEDRWRRQGHGVKFPVKPINDLALPIVGGKIPINQWGHREWWHSSIPEPSATMTVREYLSKITDWYWKDNWYSVTYGNKNVIDMPRKGATPIVDALYEAALYFRGERVTFGLGDAGFWNRWSAHPSTYEGDMIKWDKFLCDRTYTYRTNHAIDFANREKPWLVCKGTGANSSPSYENCKQVESCRTIRKRVCVEWVGGYCSDPQAVEIGTSCPDGAWVGGYCKNNRYRYKRFKKCSYEVCSGGHTSEPNYISPITQECQNNYIVLLSDGKPGDVSSDTENMTYKKFQWGVLPPLVNKLDSSETFSHVNCDSNPEPSGFRHGVCGPELTRFLADTDNSDLNGQQDIQTYTIGFGLSGEPASENYLKSLVTTDNPDTDEIEGYYSASDESELSTAFSTILNKIGASTTSFAAPGYSVNTSTELSHEKFVYIPVFDKQLVPRWSGNLKKFKIDSSGGVNVIKGKNNKIAMTEFGVFEDDAWDLWSNSTTADGKEVSGGGAASLVDPNNRLAVTDVACSSYPCDLTSESNLIKPSNANDSGVISNAVLGLDNDTEEALRLTLVNFARGLVWNKTKGVYDAIPHMGDMLHGEPAVVTYDKNYQENSASSETKPGQVVFAATNEGYLHAFNSMTGKELFAYMPSALMKNLNTQYKNSDLGNHAYGIDGYITTWYLDKNKDGVIDAAGGDKVYLYFGLRRGGRAYYALDVTDVTTPKLLWKLDSNTEHFSNLGQSWSMPYLARIRTGDHEMKEVVIFSGGYDPNQDEEDLSVRRTTDEMGNDVFIVDALTGDYIWSLQGGSSGHTAEVDVSELSHSIPGGVRLLDLNRDGAIDRMYFADTAGQVWRLELPMGPSYDLADSKLILFANLGLKAGQATGSQEARMFFNEPDVSLLRHSSRRWLAISIGSGYRAHPANDKVEDGFYVLLDGAVNVPLEKKLKSDDNFETLTISDLVKIEYIDGAINKGAMRGKTIFDMEDKAGWYLDLPESGEKVLANSITTAGSVMFTTLVPSSGASAAVADPCKGALTQGRFYSMDLLTGSAGSDLNRNKKITDEDLFAVVASNEIPGPPQRVFNDPVCVDKKCEQIVDVRVGKKNSPVTGYDSAFLESVFWTNPPNGQ
ncbi:MAG: hypothetical protein CSB47_09065 [Proteobacteria bacterium]|nr:MAG: hypothetical protein CSB47_09065 [Pseudomonadota bacterium]